MISDYVLLDTNVACLFHPKKDNDPLRKIYAPNILGKTAAISFQTVAELWGWVETRHWGESNRSKFNGFLRRFVVIPYDFALAEVWARVGQVAKSAGRRLECGDCWIVATAVHYKIPLLTNDADLTHRSIPGLEVISHLDH